MSSFVWFGSGLLLGVVAAAWIVYQVADGLAHPLHEEFSDGP